MDKKLNIKETAYNIGKMIRKVGKRNWIIIFSIAAISGAVVLNYVLFRDPIRSIGYGAGNMEDVYLTDSESVGAKQGETVAAFYASTVLSRQKAREEALAVLQTVVDSDEALDDTKAQAFSDISQIARDIENESNIETLVAAKGFADCIAVVNGSTVNVIVKSDGLLENEIAQIDEIVYEQAGVLPTNIKIIEKPN